MMTVGIWYCRC